MQYRRIILFVLLAASSLIGLTSSHAEKNQMAVPIPHRHMLENGLAVLTVERPELPLLELRAMVRAGTRHEPDEKAGLANLVARLLVQGTRDRSAMAIAEAIDFVGGSMRAYATHDATYLSISVLSRDRDLALDLLCEILTAPTFPEEELERERGLVITEMAQGRDDPRQVVADAFREAVYGDHPYHRPVVGYEDAVASLSRDDALSFYEQFYRPNNATIAIVGDFKTRGMIKALERRLGSWKDGEIPQVESAPPAPIAHSELELVRMDISQSYARFGHHGIRRNHPDYDAISVMDRVLGSVGSGRIFREVREERGLAYDARARFVPHLQHGAFYASFETKIESTQEAMDVTLEQLRRMKREGVTDEELADAKSYLTGHFPMTFETSGQLASILLDIELYDLGLDYLAEYVGKIESITKEDANRVAREYLDPEKMMFVIVTRTEDLSLEVPGIEKTGAKTGGRGEGRGP